MNRITPKDRIRELFLDGTLADAQGLLAFATDIVAIRLRLEGGTEAHPKKRGRKAKGAVDAPPITA